MEGQKLDSPEFAYDTNSSAFKNWLRQIWEYVTDVYPEVSGETGVVDRTYPVGDVRRYGAVGDGVTDDTTAIQNALDSTLYVTFPKGNFLVSDELVVRPWSRIVGAGKSDYVTTLTQTITGTRIIQTTANKVFTTNTGTPANDAAGSIHISHLTVLGGTVSAPIGTYGIYCTSSARMILDDVHAYFFTETGLYFIGGLMATLHDCVAQYCQDAGLFLDYGNFGASPANSYMSNIIGGNFRQNGNAGIRLGTSTVKVNLIGVDVESTGSYYSGDGSGIEITGGARGVLIDGCWLEGNKVHVIVGDDAGSRNTVPINTVIRNSQLWSVTTGDEKIRLNSGAGTVIENNEFFGDSSITIKVLSNNPILQNNAGDLVVKDENDNDVTVDSIHMSNVLPSPVLTGWTTSNCSVSVDEDEDSPAGPVPVYEITPAGAGTARITMPLATFAWAEVHNTIGAYFRASSSLRGKYVIATTSPAATYTSDNDQHDFTIGTEWSWHTVGKCIPDTAGGNLTLRIDVEVTTTDPFWVTGVSAVNGISYKPYRLPAAGIQALGSPLATPSVYGKSRCVTSGTNTITDLTDGAVGQEVKIIAEHALTITDGTNIFLSGSADFTMAISDTLTLIRKADGKWYELSRSDNT